jgi:hypothetical protein
MSQNINEVMSRRKAFSLLGLATAALALGVPTTVLTISDDAEAQTAAAPATTPAPAGTRGMQRRQARRIARTERRQVRRTARTQRRAIRRGVAPAQ